MNYTCIKKIKMKNSIRISGGSLKGKKIPFDFKSTLRPTSNKLKEIIFNWFQFEIEDSICLDLFAGTGSIGIEALSRHAPKVTFVELNKKNYMHLSKTISELGLKDRGKVFFKDAYVWIKNADLSEYDLIFLDPPFDQVNYESLLSAIRTQDLLAANGKIYLETDKRTEILLSKKQEVLKDKTIGDVRLMILQ